MPSPDKTWTWDDLAENGPKLDKLGNWVEFYNNGTTDARTHNPANEIDSRTVGGGGKAISYDDAGNLATVRESTGTAAWKYTYDYRNRLIKVETTTDITATPPIIWSTVAAYTYDAQNRRVKKYLTGGTDTIYLYDGWQCIEEREADGDLLRQYVYGAHYLDELVAKRESGGSLTFYLQDSNYNVVALADSTGAVVERCWYEPYGTVTITDASGGTTRSESSYSNTLLFQGQRRDPDSETGLYYFKNRYYSAELGRFLQRDPAEYRDGMSLYLAMLGSPPYRRDELGLSGYEDPTWFDYAKAYVWGAAKSVPETTQKAAVNIGKGVIQAGANVADLVNGTLQTGSLLADYLIADKLAMPELSPGPLELYPGDLSDMMKNPPSTGEYLERAANAYTLGGFGLGKTVGDAIVGNIGPKQAGEQLETGGLALLPIIALMQSGAPGSSGSLTTKAAPGEVAPRAADTPQAPENVPTQLGGRATGPAPIIGPKIARQMGPRGWTSKAIEEAIKSGKQVPAINKANGNAAIRYEHPTTGKSVVVDQVTGEVIQVDRPGFFHGPKGGDLQ